MAYIKEEDHIDRWGVAATGYPHDYFDSKGFPKIKGKDTFPEYVYFLNLHHEDGKPYQILPHDSYKDLYRNITDNTVGSSFADPWGYMEVVQYIIDPEDVKFDELNQVVSMEVFCVVKRIK